MEWHEDDLDIESINGSERFTSQKNKNQNQGKQQHKNLLVDGDLESTVREGPRIKRVDSLNTDWRSDDGGVYWGGVYDTGIRVGDTVPHHHFARNHLLWVWGGLTRLPDNDFDMWWYARNVVKRKRSWLKFSRCQGVAPLLLHSYVPYFQFF